jgi:hypothetical protein
MKKITNYLLSLLAIAGVMVFTSCDPEEETPVAAPTVEVTLVDGKAEYAIDDVVVVQVSFTAPGNLVAMSYVTINNGASSARTIVDLNDINLANATSGSPRFNFTLNETFAGQTFSIEFEVEDGEGRTAKDDVEVVVEEAKPIITHTQTLLGGQSNASEPSFYNAITDDRYNYASMRDTNSANTDWCFFYGTTNLYTLAAIDDADANTAFSAVIGANALSAEVIATRNPTRFNSTTVTAAEFDAISNEAQLLDKAEFETAGSSKANALEVGQVYAFKLASARGARFGLVKIVGTGGTDGSNRTITFVVKIQE